MTLEPSEEIQSRSPGEVKVDQPENRDEELLALRERLARLGEASRRINESLEFDAVL